MSHEPYRCISSAFATYLSAGLIGGTLRPPGLSGSLWACRKLGVSEETTTLGAAVDVKPRASLRRTNAVLLSCTAEARARRLETRIAIVGCLRCPPPIAIAVGQKNVLMSKHYRQVVDYTTLVLNRLRLILRQSCRSRAFFQPSSTTSIVDSPFASLPTPLSLPLEVLSNPT